MCTKHTVPWCCAFFQVVQEGHEGSSDLTPILPSSPSLPMDSSRCSRSILAGQREGGPDDMEFFLSKFCETH